MVRVPRTFKPSHMTGGLQGYPAVDLFGHPGEGVALDWGGGVVRRVSGRPCQDGGTPGGAYGQSLYIRAENGDDFFLTHLNALLVNVGDKVAKGQPIATLCNSSVSGKPNTTHVHVGCKKSGKPLERPQHPHLFDVYGPHGRKWLKGKPVAVVAKRLESLVARHGEMRVRFHDSRKDDDV